MIHLENVTISAKLTQYLQQEENRERMDNNKVVKTGDVIHSLQKCHCYDLIPGGWQGKIFQNWNE